MGLEHKVDLTRHTDYGETLHPPELVDSLAFVANSSLPGEKVLDVGTGGGVPGVMLAIVRATYRVALGIGRQEGARGGRYRRATRLAYAVCPAGPRSILPRPPRFDTLWFERSRGLKKLWNGSSRTGAAIGRMLVFKGPSWIDRHGEARHSRPAAKLALRKLTSYPLPGTESESVLLQIRPKDSETE